MAFDDDKGRPAMPAEIKRRVLVEAGHRCAIPTCRHIEVDIHHIVPWATCQAHEYDNLIALCPNCHRRADREEIDRKSLRLYKLNLRFAHDKFSAFEIDMLFQLSALNADDEFPWLGFMRVLLKRLEDAGYIEFIELPDDMTIRDVKFSPDRIKITPAGRQFIIDLRMQEL